MCQQQQNQQLAFAFPTAKCSSLRHQQQLLAVDGDIPSEILSNRTLAIQSNMHGSIIKHPYKKMKHSQQNGANLIGLNTDAVRKSNILKYNNADKDNVQQYGRKILRPRSTHDEISIVGDNSQMKTVKNRNYDVRSNKNAATQPQRFPFTTFEITQNDIHNAIRLTRQKRVADTFENSFNIKNTRKSKNISIAPPIIFQQQQQSFEKANAFGVYEQTPPINPTDQIISPPHILLSSLPHGWLNQHKFQHHNR